MVGLLLSLTLAIGGVAITVPLCTCRCSWSATEVQAFGAGRPWVDFPGWILGWLGVVFVRQRKTRPILGQDGLLARWVGLLWLDECEKPAPAKFRAEEPWYVVWFLAGPALGLDLLLPPTASRSVRLSYHELYRSFRLG